MENDTDDDTEPDIQQTFSKNFDVLMKFRNLIPPNQRVAIHDLHKTLQISEKELFVYFLDWWELLSFQIDAENQSIMISTNPFSQDDCLLSVIKYGTICLAPLVDVAHENIPTSEIKGTAISKVDLQLLESFMDRIKILTVKREIAEVLRNIGNHVFWIRVGRLFTRFRNESRAETALTYALTLVPNNNLAWNALVWYYYSVKGQYDNAEKLYRKSIALNHNFSGVYLNLGYYYYDHKEDYTQAEKYYKKALEIDPRSYIAYYNLAVIYCDVQKDYAKAEDAVRKVIEINPKVPWGWTELGSIMYDHKKDYDEAEKAFRKAVEVDPYYPNGWRKLGKFLEDTKRSPREAKKYLAQAAKLSDIEDF